MSQSSVAGLGILVVEDEPLLGKQITAYLQRLGADVTLAKSLANARTFLRELDVDLVLLDVHLPDGLGLELLKDKSMPANASTIVMTADGGVQGAVEAMRLGALDYLVKPFEIAELPLVLARARKARQSARLEEHQRSERSPNETDFFFGSSLAALESQLQKILAADARILFHLPPVLIEGETGTGKTSIARWIHYHGPRASQPLVELNCSALPETLAESELFGHERGAFTDARSSRMGLFEAASGGSLFLDELPSLSLPLQAKVLKAVEDHNIRRVGGHKEIPIDVRIIAASHRSLKQLADAGTFREDLFHRLDLYRLRLLPLRERPQDIPALAQLLMTRLCKRHRLTPKSITAEGLSRLLSHHWPGNVRELAHELERALVFEDTSCLNFASLTPSTRPSHGPQPAASNGDWCNPQFTFPPQGFSLESAINRLIHQALKQTDGNVSAAARLLGVSRDYLRYRLAESKSPASDGNYSPNP